MTDRQAPLVLLKRALPSRAMKDLRDAGYLPLVVESFDDIRVVQPMAVADGSIIMQSAMQAIKESGWDTKTKFGQAVARGVLDAMMRTTSPESPE